MSTKVVSERAMKILDYLKVNPRQTKGQIEREMDKLNIGSRMTIRKELDTLATNNLVIIEKSSKPNNKTQFFSINNQDDFNKIDGFISKLEKMLTEKDYEIEDIMNSLLSQVEESGDSEKSEEIQSRFKEVMFLFRDTFVKIVYWLILKLDSGSIPEEKSNTLYLRIIDLMKMMGSDVEELAVALEIKKFQDRIDRLSARHDRLSIWCRKNFMETKSALRELQGLTPNESDVNSEEIS